MNEFSVSNHIANRESRYKAADIYNKTLTGLATVEINITELCNRKCSFCPRHDPNIYPNQKLFMETSTVEQLTEQLREANWYGDVHITGFGEPHTHPHLLEIVKILGTNKNLYIEITSNGDKLIDGDLNYTNLLFSSGLKLLTIDCYDGDKQFTKRKTVMKKLTGAWRLRSHYDDGDTNKLIEQYGFNNRAGTMGGSGIQNKCYLPFYKTFIDWNGNMTLCCNDWHREAGNFGNIKEIGIAGCWNSNKLKEIRRSLAQGVRKGVCANCDIVGTKFGEDSFMLLSKD